MYKLEGTYSVFSRSIVHLFQNEKNTGFLRCILFRRFWKPSHARFEELPKIKGDFIIFAFRFFIFCLFFRSCVFFLFELHKKRLNNLYYVKFSFLGKNVNQEGGQKNMNFKFNIHPCFPFFSFYLPSFPFFLLPFLFSLTFFLPFEKPSNLFLKSSPPLRNFINLL